MKVVDRATHLETALSAGGINAAYIHVSRATAGSLKERNTHRDNLRRGLKKKGFKEKFGGTGDVRDHALFCTKGYRPPVAVEGQQEGQQEEVRKV